MDKSKNTAVSGEGNPENQLNSETFQEAISESFDKVMREKFKKNASGEKGGIASDDVSPSNTDAAESSAGDGGEKNPENMRAELDALRAAIKEVEEELKAAKDRHLRVVAEAENIRKRAEEEVMRSRKFALEAFARALLEVDDCLEMAQAGEKDGEGVRLTLRKLRAVFEQFEIRPIAPQTGADFDPALHTAMGMAEGEKANTIAAVVMKGYTLSGRVIRPAGVMVVGEAQNSQTESDKEAAESDSKTESQN